MQSFITFSGLAATTAPVPSSHFIHPQRGKSSPYRSNNCCSWSRWCPLYTRRSQNWCGCLYVSAVVFSCQKFPSYLLLVWTRQGDIMTLYSLVFHPASSIRIASRSVSHVHIPARVHECICAFEPFILETRQEDRNGWHSSSVCNSIACECVCVCVTNPKIICCGRSVCHIHRGLQQTDRSRGLVLVLVQLLLFMATDGVVALAQQQNNDPVACSSQPSSSTLGWVWRK